MTSFRLFILALNMGGRLKRAGLASGGYCGEKGRMSRCQVFMSRPIRGGSVAPNPGLCGIAFSIRSVGWHHFSGPSNQAARRGGI